MGYNNGYGKIAVISLLLKLLATLKVNMLYIKYGKRYDYDHFDRNKK